MNCLGLAFPVPTVVPLPHHSLHPLELVVDLPELLLLLPNLRVRPPDGPAAQPSADDCWTTGSMCVYGPIPFHRTGLRQFPKNRNVAVKSSSMPVVVSANGNAVTVSDCGGVG